MSTDGGKIKELRNDVGCLQFLAACNGVGFCLLILWLCILTPLAVIYPTAPPPSTVTPCPESTCSALSTAMSAAISKEELEQVVASLNSVLHQGNLTLQKRTGDLLKFVDDLQWQINNIQSGRCACNTSNFCTNDRCGELERRANEQEKVLASCEEEKQVTSRGIAVATDCSGYTIKVPGYYQVTAEATSSGGVGGKLSVHVDKTTVFTEAGLHLSVIEPMAAGDFVHFTLNGTHLVPTYSSITLIAREEPSTAMLIRHRSRRDALLAPPPTPMVVTAAPEQQGWLSFLLLGFLWLVVVSVCCAGVVVGGYLFVTVGYPRLKTAYTNYKAQK